MKLDDLKIGPKIQLAIITNVVLAILLGEFIVTQLLGFTGGTGIAVNLAINGGIAFLYGLLVSRAITRPLKNVVGVLDVLAQGKGDLTQRLKQEHKDEVGELSGYFNTFLEKLHGIISEVSQSTSRLASASDEMLVVTNESETNLNRQQAETDQVVTAMHQMAATVNEISRHASEAEASAREADQEARQGAELSEQTTRSINALVNKIEASANTIQQLGSDVGDISLILDVIRDITEQTNLLALNAAIEAARAGEVGRGFAVVADEVRSLANRTQDSTQQIGAMIGKLQATAQQATKAMEEARSQGQEGAKEVTQANQSLSRIAASVMTISEMNTQIASAAEEQNITTQEVTRNITSISDITRVTAEGASRTTGTSHELAQVAQRLEELVGQFRLSA